MARDGGTSRRSSRSASGRRWTRSSNPARLDPAGSVDFCGACHATFWDVKLAGEQGVAALRSQPNRLQSSKCWGDGDARITCVACHDPHEPLVREAASYDSRCLSCHVRARDRSRRRTSPGRAVPGRHPGLHDLPHAEVRSAGHAPRVHGPPDPRRRAQAGLLARRRARGREAAPCSCAFYPFATCGRYFLQRHQRRARALAVLILLRCIGYCSALPTASRTPPARSSSGIRHEGASFPVVFTESGDQIRIISARDASARERREYEEHSSIPRSQGRGHGRASRSTWSRGSPTPSLLG